MSTMLVVEDDRTIAEVVAYQLQREGHTATIASDGIEALERLREGPYDLIILDLMLPRLSGLDVLRMLRRDSATPVIILSAREGDADQVSALDLGADDYITKPFSIEALMARIRALLRRAGGPPAKGRLEFADLAMDLAAHRVQRNGRGVHLGPTEFRLLEFFMQNPTRVFTREELLNAVWGRDIHVEPRTVDVHIRRLRKAINAPGETDIIRTVRAAGYALDTEAA